MKWNHTRYSYRHDFRDTGRSVLVLAAFVVACFAVADVGSLAISPQTVSGGWYGTLDTPFFFTPTDSVFGLARTILYLSMAFSAWLLWRREGFSGAKTTMALFSIQLTLNLLWSGPFFRLKAWGLALVES
jgi:translocator protein